MKQSITEIITNNLRKIMNDKNMKQAAIAEYAGVTPSQFSKILNGQVQLSLVQLSNIAHGLSLREIDIFTYPDIYVKEDERRAASADEAVLQIKLSKEKRDKVMKIVLGEDGGE